MKKFLNSFSVIYVINLDNRTDRWACFQEKWAGILDFSRVKRISAVCGTQIPGYGEGPWFSRNTEGREKDWAGMAGCLLSHKRVIEDASAHGYDKVLVFEDDAVPSQYLAAVENASDEMLLRYLHHHHDWGLCYLGYNAQQERGIRKLNLGSDMENIQNNVELWQVPGVLTLHAYIINKRAYGPILEVLPDESEIWPWIARYRAIDTWIKNSFSLKSGLNVLVMAPQIVVQVESMSDILNRMSNYTHANLAVRPRETSPFMYWLYKWVGGFLGLAVWDMVRLGKYVRYSRSGFPGKRKVRDREGDCLH